MEKPIMSVVGNRHTLTPLTKTSKAMDGQRLVRVIAKQDKEGTYPDNLKESLCVSIPKIEEATVQSSITSLMPHIVAMLGDAQDSIIRELRITTGCNEVSDDEIGIGKVIEWLDEESTGSRLTKEMLAKWFTESYSDVAAEFIAEMMKFGKVEELSEDQSKVVAQKINVWLVCSQAIRAASLRLTFRSARQ
jgi:hypothetical protein